MRKEGRAMMMAVQDVSIWSDSLGANGGDTAMPHDINRAVMAAWQGKFEPISTRIVSRPRGGHSSQDNGAQAYALARTCLNREVLATVPRTARVLEVGTDHGIHLRCLGTLGFRRILGTHVSWDSVQEARQHAPTASCVQASGMHLPFREGAFDLVCTSGLLSRLCDGRLEALMLEIQRCARRWIWAWEPAARQDPNSLPIHGGERIEPMRFSSAWLATCPHLRVLRERFVPGPNGGRQMFLLEKESRRSRLLVSPPPRR